MRMGHPFVQFLDGSDLLLSIALGKIGLSVPQSVCGLPGEISPLKQDGAIGLGDGLTFAISSKKKVDAPWKHDSQFGVGGTPKLLHVG
jgi:hypothetical protein